MITGVLQIAGDVGNLLADVDLTLTSPEQELNLTVLSGDPVVVLKAAANPGDTTLTLGALDGQKLRGVVKALTILTIGAESVISLRDASGGISGLIVVPLSAPVVGTFAIDTPVTFGTTELVGIPASTISVNDAPKDVYTDRQPAYGYLVMAANLSSEPSNGWHIQSVSRISNAIVTGKIGHIDGATANRRIWVGDP